MSHDDKTLPRLRLFGKEKERRRSKEDDDKKRKRKKEMPRNDSLIFMIIEAYKVERRASELTN